MFKRINNIYKIIISVVVVISLSTTVFAGEFKKGRCADDLIMTQNLKAPRPGERYIKNGRYHWYTRGIVREADILQRHLNRLGFNAGKVDGIIGPNTKGAILRMQKFLGTKQDGYVGPLTRGLLNNSCGDESEEIRDAEEVVIDRENVDMDIDIDLSRGDGEYKDLTGINRSPYLKTRLGDKEVDFTNIYKMLDFSEIRMHDDEVDVCKIYQDDTAIETTTGTDVTDSCKFTGSTTGIASVNWNVNNIRTVNDIRNYDFSDADKSMEIAMNTGSKIYLRLGESWLGPNNTDEPRAFAAVANNIYKHYIGDFGSKSVLPDISAVEVHNEPDGRFWTGSNAGLHSLVKNTIENVRAIDSDEKIGGSGFVVKVNEHFSDRSSVVNEFIRNVGVDNLDFFSAHYYGKCEREELKNFIDWAETLRGNLDSRGVSDKEIHLTEWNIGAGNSCSGRDETVYELPKMFTYSAGLLLLAQEDDLNIEHSHFYAGNGSAMSVLTLNQKDMTALVNKVFMSFYLHKEFKGMDKVKTRICEGSTCLDSYKNIKSGKHILAQTYKDRDGFKILVINDGDIPKIIRVNLKNLKRHIKNSYEIKYEMPEEEVSIPLERGGDGVYSMNESDVTKNMVKESLSKRELSLTDDKHQSFFIMLSPYSASVIDIVSE